MSGTPTNNENRTYNIVGRPITPRNLQNRLNSHLSSVRTRSSSRLSQGTMRSNIFEPLEMNQKKRLKFKMNRSDMNFVEIPLPKNNVDPITLKKFKNGTKAVEFGIRKKRYMTLNSFNNYIIPRKLENGTKVKKAASPFTRTIYNTQPKTPVNNMWIENLFTREKMTRNNIRFVKFKELPKNRNRMATIKQLEKEIIALQKSNTRPKILKSNTERQRIKKYNAAEKEEKKVQKKILNKKKSIEKLKNA